MNIMPLSLQAFLTYFSLELIMTTNLETNNYDSQETATGRV